MRRKEFKKLSRMGLVGIGLFALFVIAIVIALPWHIWQTYAASPDDSTGLRNVRSVWATQTAVALSKMSTATATSKMAATATATGKSKAATATAISKQVTPTVAPTPTTAPTPTPTPTITTADAYTQFCRSFYQITTSMQGPTDKYADCLNLAPQFQAYLQSHNFGTSASSSGAWPAQSLVALEVPANASKTGNNVLVNDANTVEDDLTTYFQGVSSASQQNGYQDALTNWTDDPLLPLALATYSLGSTNGQPVMADATDGNPSFTALVAFLASDPDEVAKIQSDLTASLKSSTFKMTGSDCSFSTTSLTQSYQACIGADSLVDLLCDERYTSGTDTTTLYNSVMPIVENEFSGEVNSYMQNHVDDKNASDAQSAYAFIASLSNQSMKGTLIDHVLSAVVIAQ